MKIAVSPRTFTVEMTEAEINHLREVLGARSSADAQDDGLDYDLELQMYSELAKAADGE